MLKNEKRAIKWALHDDEGKCGEITVWERFVLFIDADTLFRRAALCRLHFSGFIRISAEDSLALCFSLADTLFWHTVSKNNPCVCVRLRWRRTRVDRLYAALWGPATNNIHYKTHTDLQLSNIVNMGTISVVVKWPKQACKVFDATIQ